MTLARRLGRAAPAIGLLALSLARLGPNLMAAVITGHYHPMAPMLHQQQAAALMGAIATLVYATLALRHLGGTPDRWRRRALELALPVALLAPALPLLTLWLRPPDHVLLSFRGQDHAIPRLWAPSVHAGADGAQTLVLRVCRSTLRPVYADGGGCADAAPVVFSTAPLLADPVLGGELAKGGLRHADGRVIDKGAFRLLADGGLTLDTGWQDLILWADPATGTVTAWRQCPRWDHLPDAPCDMGMQLGDLSARTTLARDANLAPILSRLAENLTLWRCPGATGCVNKG